MATIGFTDLMLGVVALGMIAALDARPQSAPPPQLGFDPPPRYDPLLHPYNGKLTIRRITVKEAGKLCAHQLRPDDRGLGCTTPPTDLSNGCEVRIVTDAELKEHGRGLTYDDVLRHEVAHCNGWRH